VQPPGDHQVEHEKEIALELENDAFPYPPEPDNPSSFDLPQRRLDRTNQERARDAHGLEAPADDSRLERLEVRDDVRQLRHAR